MRSALLERSTWTFGYDNDTIELANLYAPGVKKEIKHIDIINIPDILYMVNIIANYSFCLSA